MRLIITTGLLIFSTFLFSQNTRYTYGFETTISKGFDDVNYYHQGDYNVYLKNNFKEFSIKMENGVFFKDFFSLGISTGIETQRKNTFIPLQLNMKFVFLKKKKFCPMINLDAGYSFLIRTKYPYYTLPTFYNYNGNGSQLISTESATLNYNGGVKIEPSIGLLCKTFENLNLYAKFGISYQYFDERVNYFEDFSNASSKDKNETSSFVRFYKFHTFKLGILF